MARLVVVEREDGSARVQSVNDLPDMCKQSFRDECDINHILKDYHRTGVVRHLNEAQARYADVSGLSDYSDALVIVKAAEQQFMELPAKVRKVFHNSAAEFLDAAHDPARRQQLVEAGLIPVERPQDVVKPTAEVPAVPEP